MWWTCALLSRLSHVLFPSPCSEMPSTHPRSLQSLPFFSSSRGPPGSADLLALLSVSHSDAVTRTSGLCDARTLFLRPVRLSVSGACSFFLSVLNLLLSMRPASTRSQHVSFHRSSLTAPIHGLFTLPRVSRGRGGNTPPVVSRRLSNPICTLRRALPRHA